MAIRPNEIGHHNKIINHPVVPWIGFHRLKALLSLSHNTPFLTSYGYDQSANRRTGRQSIAIFSLT